MFKITCTTFLFIALCGSAIIKVPKPFPGLDIEKITSDVEKSDFWAKWGPHILDFLELINGEKVMEVFMSYMTDIEVLNFMEYILNPKFKEVVLEFEALAEFKEAYNHLESKGYDVNGVINTLNVALDLPPYEIPKLYTIVGKGMTGLIEDIIAELPVEEMKKLFKKKVEESPDVSDLFETLNSEEFLDIMKRMGQNPKFIELKGVFEGLGINFKHLCGLVKQIVGEYYQGVFCEAL